MIGGGRYCSRDLKDVVGSLRSAQGDCVVLMGAGCSLSAGIPLAGTLIREIKTRFAEAYERASGGLAVRLPGYNECMEQLSPNQRQALLNEYISEARINWAHMALAQMFERKVIDRVLTVNFDPLLPRACALVNFFPAIYDLADTANFRSHRIAPRSLFFLNGQHTGFVMLNAQEELEAHKHKLKTIVDDTGRRRMWIVVGYSGEADPLLDVLAQVTSFDGDLYWLGFDKEPSERLIKSGLFKQGRHAFYVGGQDADECLTHLAQKLADFPPRLLVSPHEHVLEVVRAIDFKTGGLQADRLQGELTKRLEAAIANEVQAAAPSEADANAWMLAGEFQRVLDWYAGLEKKTSESVRLAAWAHTMLGVGLSKQAHQLASTDLAGARVLWAQEVGRYAQALTTKADMHEAANNWGIALAREAQALAPTDLAGARALWAQAKDKYAQALAIEADMHEAAFNWGLVLASEARATAPTDLAGARALWLQAGDKYAQALALKADKHEAANNWGSALDDEAQVLVPSDLSGARALWAQARERYAQAMAIKADDPTAPFNWGLALANEARAIAPTDLAGARALWAQAGDKYAHALAISADEHEAANYWGNALSNEAQVLAPSDLATARSLWAQAGDRYARALAIKADKHEAANNWGAQLIHEGHAIAPADAVIASRCWQQARELLTRQAAYGDAALRVVSYNLACAYALTKDAANAVEQLRVCEALGVLALHWREDKDFDGIRDTPEFQAWLKDHPPT